MNNKKLRIITLGGLGEVGKNMVAYEYGENILIVDTGIMFPENDMLGIDYIIPDFKYILDKRNMKYDHQRDLMVHFKVTGRSYLGSAPMNEIPKDGMDMDEFCKKYDCEKLQSAIIRFNLID